MTEKMYGTNYIGSTVNVIRVVVEVVWTPVFGEVKESLIPFCFYFRNSETTRSTYMAGKEKKMYRIPQSSCMDFSFVLSLYSIIQVRMHQVYS